MSDYTMEPPIVNQTTIELLRAELKRRAAMSGGRPFRVGHRELATIIGCSISRIPVLMRRLERTSEITRTPHKNTFLISLIATEVQR